MYSCTKSPPPPLYTLTFLLIGHRTNPYREAEEAALLTTAITAAQAPSPMGALPGDESGDGEVGTATSTSITPAKSAMEHPVAVLVPSTLGIEPAPRADDSAPRGGVVVVHGRAAPPSLSAATAARALSHLLGRSLGRRWGVGGAAATARGDTTTAREKESLRVMEAVKAAEVWKSEGVFFVLFFYDCVFLLFLF